MNRKLREAFAALWLDFHMDKDAIFIEYLNRVYLGGGAYGVLSAARVYFGKGLAALSLAEAAMLAGLIQAPSAYNPIRNPEAARQRAEHVLDAPCEDDGRAGKAPMRAETPDRPERLPRIDVPEFRATGPARDEGRRSRSPLRIVSCSGS
jgi:membrane carboxypeptidase/penicillin-binding protein PbpC